MRKTIIKPRKVYALAKEFMASRPAHAPDPRGGRPRTYEDALIVAIAAIQNLYQFSFREALEYSGELFNEVPTLSTFHYRLRIIPHRTLEEFIAFLGDKIPPLAGKEAGVKIIDGTGFSYKDTYPLKFYLGEEIRQIQAHVKTVAIVGTIGKRRFVIDANVGRPYANEAKLAVPLLDRLKSYGGYVLGDKAYDSKRIISTIIEKGSAPIIKIKEGRHTQIRDPLRILSKQNTENCDIYKKRTLIEGLFGNVKQKLSSHIKVFDLKIAQTFVLIRFALFNIYMIASLEKNAIWLWFSNSLIAKLAIMQKLCDY